ncbi:MAG TPA: hypothetical protein VGG48_02320 [Rhizomicrobium sp.]
MTEGFEEDLADLRREVAEFVLSAIKDDPYGDVAQRFKDALSGIVPDALKRELNAVASEDRTIFASGLNDLRKAFADERVQIRKSIDALSEELNKARQQQVSDAQSERKVLIDSLKTLERQLEPLTAALARMEAFLRKQQSAGPGAVTTYPESGMWGFFRRRVPVWVVVAMAVVIPIVSILIANPIYGWARQEIFPPAPVQHTVENINPAQPIPAPAQPNAVTEPTSTALQGAKYEAGWQRLQARLKTAPPLGDVKNMRESLCYNSSGGGCMSFKDWYDSGHRDSEQDVLLRAAFTALAAGSSCAIPAADVAQKNKTWACLLIKGTIPFSHYGADSFSQNVKTNGASFEDNWQDLLETIQHWPLDQDVSVASRYLCNSAKSCSLKDRVPVLLKETPETRNALATMLAISAMPCAQAWRSDDRIGNGQWGNDLVKVWTCVLTGENAP